MTSIANSQHVLPTGFLGGTIPAMQLLVRNNPARYAAPAPHADGCLPCLWCPWCLQAARA